MHGLFSGQEKNIYRLINTILLAGTALFLFGESVGIQEASHLHIVTGMVSAFAVTLFFALFEKKKWLSTAGVFLLIGWTMLLIGKETSLLFFKSYGKWMAGIPGWKEEWHNGYQVMQTILLVVMIHMLQRLLDKYVWMRVLAALCMAVGMVCGLQGRMDVSYTGVVCSVCYVFLMLIEWTQRNWEKKRKKSMEQYMLWFAPFVGLFFVVLLLIPVSDKPYEWNYVKAAYRYMEDKVRYLVKEITQEEEGYQMRLSGFSEENRLQGSVGKSKELVMTLKSERPMRTNVYLVGKIYDHFEVDGWTTRRKQSLTDRYIDALQIASAAALFGEEGMSSYVLETELEICYENIATDYVFAPMKTYRLVEKNRMVGAEAGEGSLHFAKKKRYGSRFTTSFYQINRGDFVFSELLGTECVFDKKKEEQRVAKMKLLNNKKISQKEIEEYQERCHKNYSQAPQLSPKLQAFADEVTEDAKTGLERLMAIEEELSSYTYSLSVEPFPDTVTSPETFLDYFLLESRQGYCTHYATAFILLARSYGYPARYVEGYCVPMAGKKQIEVTSDMAHGWPEVYFDELGWIPFEPTPGTGQLCYVSWGEKGASGNHYELNAQDYYSRYGMTSEEERLLEEAKETERREQVKKVKEITKKVLLSLLFCIVCVLLAALAVMRVMRRRWSQERRYYYKIKRNLWLLQTMGMKLQEGETLEEFRERISLLLPAEIEMECLKTYEEVIYAGRGIDKEVLQQAEVEEKKLWYVLRGKYTGGIWRK